MQGGARPPPSPTLGGVRARLAAHGERCGEAVDDRHADVLQARRAHDLFGRVGVGDVEDVLDLCARLLGQLGAADVQAQVLECGDLRGPAGGAHRAWDLRGGSWAMGRPMHAVAAAHTSLQSSSRFTAPSARGVGGCGGAGTDCCPLARAPALGIGSANALRAPRHPGPSPEPHRIQQLPRLVAKLHRDDRSEWVVHIVNLHNRRGGDCCCAACCRPAQAAHNGGGLFRPGCAPLLWLTCLCRNFKKPKTLRTLRRSGALQGGLPGVSTAPLPCVAKAVRRRGKRIIGIVMHSREYTWDDVHIGVGPAQYVRPHLA